MAKTKPSADLVELCTEMKALLMRQPSKWEVVAFIDATPETRNILWRHMKFFREMPFGFEDAAYDRHVNVA